MDNSGGEHFLFELVSPEKLVFSEDVLSVVFPSASGYLTVMAHHAPLMTGIIPGSIRVLSSKGESLFAVLGGVADITPSGCSILAEAVAAVNHLSFEDLEKRMLQLRATLNISSGDEESHKGKDLFYQLTGVGDELPKA